MHKKSATKLNVSDAESCCVHKHYGCGRLKSTLGQLLKMSCEKILYTISCCFASASVTFTWEDSWGLESPAVVGSSLG